MGSPMAMAVASGPVYSRADRVCNRRGPDRGTRPAAPSDRPTDRPRSSDHAMPTPLPPMPWNASPLRWSAWRSCRPGGPTSRGPTPSSGRRAASGCGRCRGSPGFPTTSCADRAGGRRAAREHAPVRGRPARQQRPALGCPRHGEELAGQGDPRPRTSDGRAASCWSRSTARTSRASPRLLHLLAETDRRCLPVLRRPVVRRFGETSYKSLKAVLEGGSRAGRPTSCSTPPPTAAT